MIFGVRLRFCSLFNLSRVNMFYRVSGKMLTQEILHKILAFCRNRVIFYISGTICKEQEGNIRSCLISLKKTQELSSIPDVKLQNRV